NPAAQAEATVAPVRHVGAVLAGEPQHGVGGGLAAGTGAADVADVSYLVPLLLERLDEGHGTALTVLLGFERSTFTLVLEHGQRVPGDVGTGGGSGSGRWSRRVGCRWQLA